MNSDWNVACLYERIIFCSVILSEAPAESFSDIADWREVEGSRKCLCYHAAERRSYEELFASNQKQNFKRTP
jgi:hypothetical protein